MENFNIYVPKAKSWNKRKPTGILARCVNAYCSIILLETCFPYDLIGR